MAIGLSIILMASYLLAKTFLFFFSFSKSCFRKTDNFTLGRLNAMAMVIKKRARCHHLLQKFQSQRRTSLRSVPHGLGFNGGETTFYLFIFMEGPNFYGERRYALHASSPSSNDLIRFPMRDTAHTCRFHSSNTHPPESKQFEQNWTLKDSWETVQSTFSAKLRKKETTK